jgi:hypothetical protein
MATTREEKIQKLVEFALEFKDDPDFNRLTFPVEVLKILAEKGVTLKPREFTAAQAADACFNMTSTQTYTSNKIEVIDQTSLECSFPPLPVLASPTDTNETKSPELEDSPSLPASCAVVSTEPVARDLSSVESLTPLPDQTE